MSDDEKETRPDFALENIGPQNPRALADFLGLSPRNISLLANEGVMVRTGRGQYDAKASTQAYIKQLRARVPDRGSDRYEEEVQLKRAQRELRELELARLRGEVVPVAEMSQSIAEVFAMLSEQLHALESRLAPFMLPGIGRETSRHEIDQLRDSLVRSLGKYCDDLAKRDRARRAKTTKKRRAMGGRR